MLNTYRTSRWLRFSPIVAADVSSKKLKDQAAALDRRREELRRAQDVVDGTIEDLRDNAFEEDNILAASETIADEAAELLRREIALRHDLADLLPAIREEARTHADKAKAALKAAEGKAFTALVDAGWPEDNPQVKGFVVFNQHVKNAKLKAAGIEARATDYQSQQANEAAIAELRKQLNDIAARTLRGAGV